MSKKWDRYRSVKLLPGTYKTVKQLCDNNNMRPSVAKMVDALLLYGIIYYTKNGPKP